MLSFQGRKTHRVGLCFLPKACMKSRGASAPLRAVEPGLSLPSSLEMTYRLIRQDPKTRITKQNNNNSKFNSTTMNIFYFMTRQF